jgi:hypothetical protein
VKHPNEGARAHGYSQGRPPQFVMPARHDPYRADNKPQGEQVCPDCGLVSRRGRWMRAQATPQAKSAACPACRRTADKLPAGILTIEGAYACEKREDVLATARNVADKVESEHPLERIMSIETVDGRLVITTTDVHLVQAIGRALHGAFGGSLHYGFQEGDDQLRVSWAA